MVEAVSARPKGLDLYARRGARKPLGARGRRADALSKLGIESVQDLLQHYPRYHVDRTKLRTIAELAGVSPQSGGAEVQVHARVIRIDRPIRTRTGKRMINGRIGD